MVQRRGGQFAGGIVPDVSRVTPVVLFIDRASHQAIPQRAEIHIVHTDRMETDADQTWHPIQDCAEAYTMHVFMRWFWITVPGTRIPEKRGEIFAAFLRLSAGGDIQSS
jgi:hypothetical protein